MNLFIKKQQKLLKNILIILLDYLFFTFNNFMMTSALTNFA
jgi:hypothetical protein